MIENNKDLAKESKQNQDIAKQIASKPLKLETVNEGDNEDDVLVRGADKTIKFVSRSEFSNVTSQNLYSVMNEGSSATVNSMIYMEASDSGTGGITSIAMTPSVVDENVTGMTLSTEGLLYATGKAVNFKSSIGYGTIDITSVGLTVDGNNNKVFIGGAQGVQIDGRGGGISINGQGGAIDMTHFLGAKINDKNIITSIDGVEAGLDGSANLLGVSSTQSGIVNNTALQELGGVDKTINDVRIGRGNSNVSSNTVVGFGGLLNNSTGRYNAAVGLGGLSLNTTGEQNSAFGYTALYRNNTGNNNTGIGSSSLYTNQTGSNNTAIGAGALAGNTTQTSLSNARNTAIGCGAGLAIRTGSDNVLIGGDNPLATNSGLMNGNKNIEIGKLNNSHQTGDNNVLIGWANAPSTTLNNNVIISDGAGNIAIRKTDTNQLLAPTLTKALVVSGGSTSLVNKDYADNNLPTMVTSNAAPTSATATGVKGDIRIDNDYVYVCVNTNTWKRIALTTW